jgi:Asp-tRNA(Asn)/Glu-tRNA(Gln) amidotransferase A subunit family amidase
MGWGLEVTWWNLPRRPRFGVVDEVRMRHLTPAGEAYAAADLVEQLERQRAEVGAANMQPQETFKIWPAWTSVWQGSARAKLLG